jgi:hypothetical protein
MEKIIEKHAEALAADLRKAKKEKKWRGDGHGNLYENRAVDDAIEMYKAVNFQKMQDDFRLSIYFPCDQEKLNMLWKTIKTTAMAKAKAQLWTA